MAMSMSELDSPTLAQPTTTQAIRMNSSARIAFAIAFLLFFSAIIVYVIIYGKADNSLHSSALAWAFLGVMGILAALGFGAVIEAIPYLFAKK